MLGSRQSSAARSLTDKFTAKTNTDNERLVRHLGNVGQAAEDAIDVADGQVETGMELLDDLARKANRSPPAGVAHVIKAPE